jgi:hypothetical protein
VTIALAMMMLSEDAPLTAADVARELASGWPELPKATELEDGDGTLALTLADCNVILGKMPGPIPWSDLEGPCETSILWPDAAEEIQRHKLHWIITIQGDLEPVDLSTRLTQATAAALAACETAIGVYWGNALLIVPKPLFIDMAREVMPEEPPLLIWVDFRVGSDSDETSGGFTYGMQALGHMEFETQSAPEPPEELHDRLISLASYVVVNGPVIEDGHTVGQDADEKIRVEVGESSYGLEGQVMRLIYE